MKKILLWCWMILTAVSVFFFLKRDRIGNYVQESTYAELYAPPSAKWTQATKQYTAEELAWGKKFSDSGAGIHENVKIFDKAVLISRWLQQFLSQCKRGRPLHDFDAAGIHEKIYMLKNKTTPVWCGTYGMLFCFFAASQNITSRYIESIVPGDTHVVNEFYDSLRKEWILTDIAHNVNYATTSEDHFIKAADIIIANQKNTLSKATIFSFKDSTVSLPYDVDRTEWQHFFNAQTELHYYYLTDGTSMYTPSQKIKRYLLPQSWYEVYPPKGISNFWFYIRSGIFFLWCIVSILLTIAFIKNQ